MILKYIEDHFSILEHENLESLSGFDNLGYVGGNMTIGQSNSSSWANPELEDFCALENLIQSGGLQGAYNVVNNGYNPTLVEMQSGNCMPPPPCDTTMDIQTSCDSYLWIDSMTYLSSNNTAEFILTNVDGCDSLIQLDLTINTSDSVNDIQMVCDSLLWINGTVYYADNTTASHTLLNSSGCDSIVYLNLDITEINATITQSGTQLSVPTQVGATYQWIDCITSSPILGETSNSFTATENGSYAVEISIADCEKTSDCKTIMGIGIEEIETIKVTISPNPVQDFVTFRFGDDVNQGHIEISDMLGKTYYTFELNQTKEQHYNLSELPTGIYNIEITLKDNKVNKKIVKM